MASFIGIDWNSDGLRLVAGRGSGSKLVLEQAIFLPEPFRENPTDALAVGKQLLPLLKQAGIKSGTAYAAVGREHLVCRDIRYPDVPAHEVPAIIQFQVSKELAIPAEQAAIDYTPIGLPWPSGEKRALGMVLNRNVLRAYEKLCEGMGLTLAGLTSRAFALQANWLAGPGKVSAAEVVGVIAGKELTVIRKGEVLFSRQQDETEPITADLRRSLAAYASQFPKHPIQELFLAELAEPPGLDDLRAALRLPIHLYNPWSSVRSNLGQQTDVRFAGACGLMQLVAQSQKLPLDFRTPKKGEPPKNKLKDNALLAAVAGFLLLLLLGGAYAWELWSLDDKIDQLEGEVKTGNVRVKSMGDVDQQLKEVQEWTGKEVVILDEVYDLISAFPDMPGLRVNRAHFLPFTQSAAPAGQKAGTAAKANKEIKYVAQLTLEISAEKPETLDRFRQELGAIKDWDVADWKYASLEKKQVTAQVWIRPRKPQDYSGTFTEPVNKSNTTDGATSPRGPRRMGRGGRP